MTTKRPVATDDADADARVDRRSRRNLLAGALGATGVMVAQAIARPLPVEAATNVHLGATNTAGHVTAIRTRSAGSSGTAIQGEVIASTPGSGSAGVRGKNKGSSSTSAGVRGSHSGAGRGVYGSSATGVGVVGTGGGMGVQGASPSYGVFGYTTPDTGGTGVYGRGADGVRGRSYTGRAVVGETDSGVGVYGAATSAGAAVKAVWGKATGTNANGVVGEASTGTAAYGVWGISTAGYAGVFSGKVFVTGILSKGGGSFRIDHPLDPENRILSHSFVESPDMMNVYNGNVRTGARGTATVRLPRYFGALNRDFRYQLTVIGATHVGILIADQGSAIVTVERDVEGALLVTGIERLPFDLGAVTDRVQALEAEYPASDADTPTARWIIDGEGLGSALWTVLGHERDRHWTLYTARGLERQALVDGLLVAIQGDRFRFAAGLAEQDAMNKGLVGYRRQVRDDGVIGSELVVALLLAVIPGARPSVYETRGLLILG